ncbi:MAG TPA: hypothetical protein VN838_31780, partial [Bradyrhizobium sp.]|nr:hypothetical protein [Bradyrhizobium sp.]
MFDALSGGAGRFRDDIARGVALTYNLRWVQDFRKSEARSTGLDIGYYLIPPKLFQLKNFAGRLVYSFIHIGAARQRRESEGFCPMASPNSFRKHGTFIYEVSETIADYGSTKLAVEAMQKAGMTHAWVRIHGPAPYGAGTKKIIAGFIAALKAAGIGVAAWGWCDGSDPTANAKLALKELSFFGLTDYIADIEHGEHGANWTENEITKFCTLARAGITGGFGITT